MATNNQNSAKSYDRIYITKYKEELQKHGIEEDTESFINRAFYKLLNENIPTKEGDTNGSTSA
jgi:hypothetical protein